MRFSLRLPQDLMETVKKCANGVGWSVNHLLNEIIESWAASGKQVHAGNSEQVLQRMDQMAAIVSFADHAFRRNEYAWAIREYRRLEAVAEAFGAPALMQFALYRQTYCHWALANLLLNQARQAASRIIKEPTSKKLIEANKRVCLIVERAMAAAEKETRRTIGIYKSFLKRETHALMRYNLACIQSFYATLLIEKVLLVRPDLQDKAQKSPKGWRDIREINQEDVEKAGQAALNALKQLTEPPSKPSKKLDASDGYSQWVANCPVDRDWLVGETKHDEDLEVIRSDKEFNEVYVGWYKDAKVPDDQLEKLLNAVERLDSIYDDLDSIYIDGDE